MQMSILHERFYIYKYAKNKCIHKSICLILFKFQCQFIFLVDATFYAKEVSLLVVRDKL